MLFRSQTQLEMFERLLTNGLLFSPQQFVADRYLIIIPVRIFDMFGIEPILATKFLQAVCLLLLYRVCVKFLENNNLSAPLPCDIFCRTIIYLSLNSRATRSRNRTRNSIFFPWAEYLPKAVFVFGSDSTTSASRCFTCIRLAIGLPFPPI